MQTLLQINVTANCGSHGKIAEDIGKLVLAKGWRSVIAYGQCATQSCSEVIRIGNKFSIYEHGLESRLLDNHGLSSRTATKHFLEKIEVINPTIIHLHNIHGYYLNYRILFQYLTEKRIPVVWTLHDCWPFTGHCPYFEYAGCDRWKNGCYPPCPCKGLYPKSVLLDATKNNYKLKKQLFSSLKKLTIVPVSNWLGDLTKQSFLGRHPIKVIHNGIDIDLFRPFFDTQDRTRIKYNIGNKKVILGVANIWEERKGLRDFIRLREYLSENYVIVLVGRDGNKKEKIPSGIIRVGRTQDQHELALLYSIADIFLNLTYEDNYPTTNLEAMACGTPVLTYRTGGSPEAITSETGWIVEKGQVEEAAAIIESYMRKGKEKIERIRQNCRKHAENEFDKNRCFIEYYELYRKYVF